jgi:hypothetical protein
MQFFVGFAIISIQANATFLGCLCKYKDIVQT